MQATQPVKVPLSSHLSPTTSTGHVLDGLTTGSLILIGKFFDDDCAALFTKYNVHLVKNGTVIIKGQCNNNGLWHIPFAPKSPIPLSPQIPSPPLHEIISCIQRHTIPCHQVRPCFISPCDPLQPPLHPSPSYQKEPLHSLAWNHYRSHPTTPSTFNRHIKRPPQGTTTEHPLHQAHHHTHSSSHFHRHCT